jgi:predicted ATPase
MTLSIRLLGRPEISFDHCLVPHKGHKPVALLAYLIVSGKPHSREGLVDLLYDETDDPRRSLRWTLNQLRQIVGADYVLADRHTVSFNFEGDYWLDVDALVAGETDLYRGDFLEGLYVRDAPRFMDWAFFERERVRKIYETILTEKLAADEIRGQYQAVIAVGHQLVQLDNLREEWYRSLMQAYALVGNRDAALAQYDVCRKLLAVELQAEPSPETTALLGQIRAGSLVDPRSLADIPAQLPSFLQRWDQAKSTESAAFVAREHELERLDQFLQRALAGQGQVVFVAGSAGRGKTALLNEFSRRAQAAQPHLLVAMGHCDLYAGIGDPYLPFRDIMAMLSGDVEARLATGAISFEQARRLWTNLLPVCQAILDHGRGLIDVLVSHQDLLARATAAAGRVSSDLGQLRLLAEHESSTQHGLVQDNVFQQLFNVLQAISARQPLLLLLDDLQWADASSISLLFHLGRRLQRNRIMVVAAYRPEEVASGRSALGSGQVGQHPLEPVLTEFKRMFGDVWVDLGDTGEAEDRRFVDTYIDLEPNQLGPAFRQAMLRHTGGQPLFTVELLRAMQDRGDLIQNARGQWVESASLNWEHLPARVEAVIEERINRLADELRQALTIASVDGEEFTAQVVAQVQGVNERRLLSQLSQVLAKQHRLVHERGQLRVGPHILSRYQFAHALFQRYLYHDLGPEERRLLHTEIGEALEALYSGHCQEIAAQLARHFQQAQLPQKAWRYLRQAGEKAGQSYANDEAVLYFSRALDLIPASAATERFELLLAREQIFDLQGERDRQMQDLEELRRLAQALDDHHQQAELALRWSNFAEETSDYPAAIAAAQAAIALAQTANDVDREAQGYLQWGQALWRQGDCNAARIQLTQGLSRVKQPPLKARCLRGLGLVFWTQGNFAEAKQHFSQALRIFGELGDQQGEALALNNLGIILAQHGDYAQASTTFQEALGLCRQTGDRKVEGDVLNNLGVVLGHQGHYPAAKAKYEQALQIKQEIGDRRGQAMAYDNLGDVAKCSGDYSEAEVHFEQSLLIRREVGDRLGEGNELNNLGNILDFLGDYMGARAYYRRALLIRREIGDRQGESETLAHLSLLYHHLGDDAMAHQYGSQALQIALELEDRHLLGYAWAYVGHASAGQGHLVEAASAYQQALTIRRGLGEHNRAMDPLAGLARLALTQGDSQAAQAWVGQILKHLHLDDPSLTHPQSGLEGTEEPIRIFLTCYRVLQASQDPRAWSVLARAHQLLQTQADKISDKILRCSFIENVTVHRDFLSELTAANPTTSRVRTSPATTLPASPRRFPTAA